MFSCNNKISGRQMKRTLILDIFGISTLMLPGMLALTAGTYGGISIALGMIITILAISIIYRKKNVKEKIKESTLIKVIRFFWSAFLVVHFILAGIICLKFSSDMIQSTLLSEVNINIIAVLLAVISGYNVSQGIEGKARISEIIFGFIFIPLFFMLIFSLGEFEWRNIIRVTDVEPRGIAIGAYYVFVVFTMVICAIFPQNLINDKNKIKKSIIKSVLFCGVLDIIIYEILQGVFLNELLIIKKWPVISLMTVTQLPGKISGRVDAIMAALWIISLFAVVSMFINTSSGIINSYIEIEKNYVTQLIIAGILAVGNFVCSINAEIFDILKFYMIYIGVPLVIIIFGIKGRVINED